MLTLRTQKSVKIPFEKNLLCCSYIRRWHIPFFYALQNQWSLNVLIILWRFIISCFVRLFFFNCLRFAYFLKVSDVILWFQSAWSFNRLNFETIKSAGRTCDLRRRSRQWSNLRRISHFNAPANLSIYTLYVFCWQCL